MGAVSESLLRVKMRWTDYFMRKTDGPPTLIQDARGPKAITPPSLPPVEITDYNTGRLMHLEDLDEDDQLRAALTIKKPDKSVMPVWRPDEAPQTHVVFIRQHARRS